jgi:hypothetical protein
LFNQGIDEDRHHTGMATTRGSSSMKRDRPEKKNSEPGHLRAAILYGTFDANHETVIADLEAKQASSDRLEALLNKIETPAERRSRLKRERLDAMHAASKRKAGAATPRIDERTAAGGRELQLDNLGHTSRERSLRSDRVFPNKAQASPERVRAVDVYLEVWHGAHAGIKSVDLLNGGGGGGYRNIMPSGFGSHDTLTRMRATIGAEAETILFYRVIENMSFAWMAKQGFGSEHKLRAKFVEAVDAAARFFGFVPESRAVRMMREALSRVGTVSLRP